MQKLLDVSLSERRPWIKEGSPWMIGHLQGKKVQVLIFNILVLMHGA